MKILISGICGFVGSRLALELQRRREALEIFGIDNFLRPGSETNRTRLRETGITVFHADLRNAEDLESLPPADWVLDAAANPSVLAGIDGRSSSRQLASHNLWGTVNLLEYCRKSAAGFILLSTSRVYSIPLLAGLPVAAGATGYHLAQRVAGAGPEGINEHFSTQNPISLYGASKLASEAMAAEYGCAFGFPVRINRCGVLAGAGQFGRADQGIFSFWLHSWASRKPLRYIGFGGNGLQTRDCLHPGDLASLISRQIDAPEAQAPLFNIGGGPSRAMSLRELSGWCEARWGSHAVESETTERPFDAPWIVMDSREGRKYWGWEPTISLGEILDEIAVHAEANPNWLDLSTA